MSEEIYPTKALADEPAVAAKEPTLLEMYGSDSPATAGPMPDVPHFEPIHLTEQIPLEYAAPRIDLPIPNSPSAMDWSRLPERPISRTPRPSTIVWGFILLATGLGLIASELGHPIDFGLGIIYLFAAAGIALVAAAAASGVRKKTA